MDELCYVDRVIYFFLIDIEYFNAENLAPAGTYLVVKNSGTVPVTVRLWVELYQIWN